MALAAENPYQVDISDFAIGAPAVPTNLLGIPLIEGRFILRRTLRDLARVTEYVLKRLERDRIVQHAKLGRRGERLYTQETVQIIHTYMMQSNELKTDSRRQRRKKEQPSTSKYARPSQPISKAFTDEQAVAVFKLLEKSIPLHRIVIMTGIGPNAVQAIAVAYAGCSRSIVISEGALARLNGLPGIESPIMSVDDLITTIRAGLKKRTCAKCREAERADSCVECILGDAMAAVAAMPGALSDDARPEVLVEEDRDEDDDADHGD